MDQSQENVNELKIAEQPTNSTLKDATPKASLKETEFFKKLSGDFTQTQNQLGALVYNIGIHEQRLSLLNQEKAQLTSKLHEIDKKAGEYLESDKN